MDVLSDFIGVRRFPLTSTELTYRAEVVTLPKSYHRTRIGTEVAHWWKAKNLNSVVTRVKDSFMLKLFLGGGPNFPEVPASVRQKLYEQFRPEVEELETLLNRDLSSWKFPSQASSSEIGGITTSPQCRAFNTRNLPTQHRVC
ncbi:MAG: hypothetical protein NVS9B5_37430 [Terriglobales bacterium]